MLTRSRQGATLIDLIVALALASLIGTVALRTLLANVRWTERGILRAERDAQLVAASEVASTVLVAMAPGDGHRLTDTAAVWDATIAGGTICALPPGQASVTIDSRSDGTRLGSAITSPQQGDLLEIFDDGPAPHPGDDRWTRHLVTSAGRSPGGCGASQLLDPVRDAAYAPWILDLATSPASSQLGAPARLLRPTRLALYRSTADWAMGLSEQPPGGGWTATQPVASPLEPPATGGLHLDWLDSTFAPAIAAPQVARLVVRAPTRAGLRAFGGATLVDSVRRVIRLRNQP